MTVLRRLAAFATLLAGAAALATAADATVEKTTVVSRGKERTVFVFAPSSVSPEHPAPLVVAFHGSGGSGKTMVEKWKPVAEKEGILVAAPDSTDAVHWASPQDGPQLLEDVVKAMAERHPVDPRRVYLFGHSAGAVFALQMASLESEYFAAAAVHAGAVDPKYFGIFDYAARKIPIAIWIGTKDQFFPLDSVRATADALKTRGFPVTLTEIPGHTHDYLHDEPDLNLAIWDFLAAQKLPEQPRFRRYADPK
ncbi:MAG TPA: dienelactone hydrolase family protein [Thermoanaerobaculia bacterium]|nr:dienelactone hydrolase family protein [Thermoanaerobaculia bacterium]